MENINSLKTFGNKYFKEEMFRPEKKVIKDVVYDKNNLQIGKRLDGSVYTMDLSEALRIVIVGATRCMPLGTKIKTKDGLVNIEDATEVLSYNFEKNIFELKPCIVQPITRRKLAIIKITKEEMIYPYGYESFDRVVETQEIEEIRCSHDHKLFAKRDGKIQEIRAKDLKKSDKLLRVIRRLEEVDILDIELTDEEMDMVDITVPDNHNFILENNILSHNSGKSYLLRSMSDRVRKTGRSLMYLLDSKDEFKSSKKPVQFKFQKGLLPGEKPTTVPIVSLRPTFFKPHNPKLSNDNDWYSVDMNQLTQADFMTLMNSSKATVPQRTTFDIIFQELKKILKKEDVKFSIDMIYNIIDNITELNASQRNSMKYKFKPLENSKFFMEKYQKNIVDLMKEGKVPAINFEGFDMLGDSGFLFPEVVLNIILREVINARRGGKIDPVWVVIDEATRFINEKEDNAFKSTVLRSVDLDTKYWISYVFAGQNIEDFPPSIMKQSKYIFIPATVDIMTIRSVLMNTGLVKNQQTASNEALALKRKMKGIKFSWVVINRMTASKDLIIPLSCLSNHMETSN